MSAPAEPHAFSAADQQAVYRAVCDRRDMRHFSGATVADGVLQRLLSAAHHAPSVGFMQLWRFIRVCKSVLCLGPVETFYKEPMLQTEKWARRSALADLVFENCWGQPAGHGKPSA